LSDALRALIDDAVSEAGAQVYDIEFNGTTLQVFVDCKEGVTVDVCRRVSEQVSVRLDQADLIQGRYYLEVSSPGLERKLRGIDDFRCEYGKYAHVVANRGAWDGVIESVSDDSLTLVVTGAAGVESDIVLPVNEIIRANLKVRDEEIFARKKTANEPQAAGRAPQEECGERQADSGSRRAASGMEFE